MVLQVVALGQVYVREDESFVNAAFVRTSDAAKAALFGADQAVAAGDLSTAAQRFQEMLDLPGDALLEFGARTWLPAADVARRRLLALPESSRVRVRELFASSSAEAAKSARLDRDPSQLRRFARRFPLAAEAVPLLREAIHLAAESGAVVEARRSAELLGELDALRSIDVARWVAAHGSARDPEGLSALLARFASRREEPIRVGGVDTTLGRYCDEVAAAIARSPSLDLARAPLELVPIGMQTSAEHHLDEQANDPANGNPLRDLDVVPQSATFAVRSGGDYVVAGRYGVYLHAGTSPRDSKMPDFQYQRLFGVDSPQADVVSRALEPVVAGDLLQLAITRRLGVGFDGSDLDSVVFALRIGEGRPPEPAWRWDAPLAPDDENSGFVFVSPGAVAGDLVLYSASRQRATSECAVFAFDRETGALRWSRFIASAAEIAEFDERNQPTEVRRVIPAPVVVKAGIAYVVTNLGVVGALDAGTGAIEWFFKYNRMSPTDVDRYRRERFYDTGGWSSAPPIVTSERVIVTPEDSRFLYVLSRVPGSDGSIVLNDPFHKLDRAALVGYDEKRERLLFEARHVVRANVDGIYFQATDLDGVSSDGRGWTTLKFENEEQRVGRCAVRDDTLVIPTTKRLVFVDLAKEGRLVRQVLPPREWIEQDERRYFGNLSFRDDELISCSPRFVVALRPR